MTKELTTQELADFLGISRQALKKLKDNGNLSGRLLDMGYGLVKSEKQGRKVIYFLEEIVIVPKETWEELAAEEFPTIRKIKELGVHTKERLINRTEATRSEITNKTGVSRKTTERWDGMLVEKGYMRDGGYTYYEIRNRRLNQITYADYQKYWSSRGKTRALVRSLTEAESEHGKELALENITTVMQDSYCIRVKSYLVNEFTEKYQRLVAAL